MDPARKVLLVDGLVGGSAILTGVSGGEAAGPWWVVPLFLAVVGWIWTVYYRLDRRHHLGEYVGSLVGGVVALAGPGLVALVALVLDVPSADTVWFAVFTGYGVALLGNRFVYGVLRPIPEERLARTGGAAV